MMLVRKQLNNINKKKLGVKWIGDGDDSGIKCNDKSMSTNLVLRLGIEMKFNRLCCTASNGYYDDEYRLLSRITFIDLVCIDDNTYGL